MFTRFITWLFVRFLKCDDLLKIVSTRMMHKGQDRFVMQRLYTVHDDHRLGHIDYKSFNTLSLENLMLQFTPRELSGIHLLSFIRSNRTRCADATCVDDGSALVKAIVDAVATPNKLKREVAVKAVLFNEFPFLVAGDIAILTAAAIECNYATEVYVTFINSPKGNRHD